MITLKKLVEELKERVGSVRVEHFADYQKKASPGCINGRPLFEPRVILPEDFEIRRCGSDCDDTLIFKDMSLSREEKPKNHVWISPFFDRDREKVIPILERILEMARGLQVQNGYALFRYQVYWTPSDFQDETDLPMLDEPQSLQITKTALQKSRPKESHRLNSMLIGDEQILTVRGAYREKFQYLGGLFGPQTARILLTKEDIKKLSRAKQTKKIMKGIIESEEHEKRISPYSREAIYYPTADGQIRELTQALIDYNELHIIADKLGIKLADIYSRVKDLIKSYSSVETKLADLKLIAREVGKISLGAEYDESEVHIKTQGYNETDLTLISKLRLPRKSKILSFIVEENFDQPYRNEVGILEGVGTRYLFWCKTSLDNPWLLPIQEYACDTLGIRFK